MYEQPCTSIHYYRSTTPAEGLRRGVHVAGAGKVSINEVDYAPAIVQFGVSRKCKFAWYTPKEPASNPQLFIQEHTRHRRRRTHAPVGHVACSSLLRRVVVVRSERVSTAAGHNNPVRENDFTILNFTLMQLRSTQSGVESGLTASILAVEERDILK
jgi:hypothetical protein